MFMSEVDRVFEESINLDYDQRRELMRRLAERQRDDCQQVARDCRDELNHMFRRMFSEGILLEVPGHKDFYSSSFEVSAYDAGEFCFLRFKFDDELDRYESADAASLVYGPMGWEDKDIHVGFVEQMEQEISSCVGEATAFALARGEDCENEPGQYGYEARAIEGREQ